jgi:hypothetical protein
LKLLKVLLVITAFSGGGLWAGSSYLNVPLPIEIGEPPMVNCNLLFANYFMKQASFYNQQLDWLMLNSKIVNDSLVLLELERHGFPYKKEFLHLIKKESGNYKSKLSADYNNITGMKFPKRRKT